MAAWAGERAAARLSARRPAAVLVLALALSGAAPVRAETTVFSGAVVIDGSGAPPIPDAVVVVLDGRIAAIGPRSATAIPPGARLVDLSGRWIIPGLIDAHVHFFQSGGLYARPDIIDLREARPYEDEIAAVKARLPQTLARYLASGVTAVADMGGPM